MTKSKVQDGRDMPRGGWPDEALGDIAARRDALRQAANLPGADPRTLIEAALTELDATIEALGAAAPAADGPDQAAEALPEAVRTERRLLHAVFQQAPVPLFLLEQDGTIRRANNRAAALLGVPSGYATGKTLASFVDLPFRAAGQTQVAARPPAREASPSPLSPPRRPPRHHPRRDKGRPAGRPACVHRRRAARRRGGGTPRGPGR